ncbi:MAG: hypothetical protein WCI55_01550 [Armatimonadota bacterium]
MEGFKGTRVPLHVLLDTLDGCPNVIIEQAIAIIRREQNDARKVNEPESRKNSPEGAARFQPRS